MQSVTKTSTPSSEKNSFQKTFQSEFEKDHSTKSIITDNVINAYAIAIIVCLMVLNGLFYLEKFQLGPQEQIKAVPMSYFLDMNMTDQNEMHVFISNDVVVDITPVHN